ncbi:hypothetical protein ABFV79_16765, partial [Brucella melitensis]
DGAEVLLPLTRANDGSLGVDIPSDMRPQYVRPFALGGVPNGTEPGARAAMMDAGKAGAGAPGAITIDYRPTYMVN